MLADRFFQLAKRTGALSFGDFTLKSGRHSPYFFNAGAFADGAALGELCELYAMAIVAAKLDFDVLFGPAYKGIPLAAGVAIALARHGRNVGFAYDRKETKDHGEGGVLVGAALDQRVLVIDDVISAGTSVRHSLRLIRQQGGQAIGVAIALDRQERMTEDDPRSSVSALSTQEGLAVVAIATLSNLLTFADAHAAEHRAAIAAYRDRFGAQQ